MAYSSSNSGRPVGWHEASALLVAAHALRKRIYETSAVTYKVSGIESLWIASPAIFAFVASDPNCPAFVRWLNRWIADERRSGVVKQQPRNPDLYDLCQETPRRRMAFQRDGLIRAQIAASFPRRRASINPPSGAFMGRTMTSNDPSAEEAMKEMERRHDAKLIGRMSGGDEGALAEFYQRHSQILYGVAVKILNDPREAEDALQEGLIRMWRSSATYQPKLSSPFSWAVMIVRNKAIDRLRVLQRNNRVVDRVAFEAAFDRKADEKSATEPDFRERRAMACSALSQLPRDQREPLELAFFRGLTHEQVAAHLETPLGTVKARIRRGLIQIRKAMSNHHE